jgi:hypothetical protein
MMDDPDPVDTAFVVTLLSRRGMGALHHGVPRSIGGRVLAERGEAQSERPEHLAGSQRRLKVGEQTHGRLVVSAVET